MNYTLGVDLGTRQDYSALVLLRRSERLQEPRALPGTWQAEEERRITYSVYEVPLLERLPLGVEYRHVISRIQQILEFPQLYRQHVDIVVDATGVGVPVLQQMYAARMNVIGVTITAGTSVNQNDSGYTVPKRDLVSSLQVVAQSNRLKVSPRLKLAEEFKGEIQVFRRRPTTARNETYEADIGEHDDLVLACAIAVWYADRAYGYTAPQPLKSEELYNPLRVIRD